VLCAIDKVVVLSVNRAALWDDHLMAPLSIDRLTTDGKECHGVSTVHYTFSKFYKY